MRIIATVNAIEQGNAAWRRFADEQTYTPLYGTEVGDEDAGRRLVYSAEFGGAPDEAILDVMLNQDNVVGAEFDERIFGIPEPLPPRVAEVEEQPFSNVPEADVLSYLGVGSSGLTGAGAMHPNGVEVAVLDTGLDRIWAERKGDRLVAHEDFTDDPGGALDPGHFHGTHVAGLLTANTRMRLNVAKVLAGDGYGYTSWIVGGIYWAIRQGCRVANLSLGGGRYSQSAQDAVSYARRRGCLIVAAMGNSGVHEKEYPAAYIGATGVIASKYWDALRAEFSNYGEWAHGTTHGVNVLSWGLDGALVRASGTSMATPLYARALALLIAEHGGPSACLKALGATAMDTPEPVLEEGYGRAYVARAHDELLGVT